MSEARTQALLKKGGQYLLRYNREGDKGLLLSWTKESQGTSSVIINNEKIYRFRPKGKPVEWRWEEKIKTISGIKSKILKFNSLDEMIQDFKKNDNTTKSKLIKITNPVLYNSNAVFLDIVEKEEPTDAQKESIVGDVNEMFIGNKGPKNLFPSIKLSCFTAYVQQQLEYKAMSKNFCQLDVEWGVLKVLSQKSNDALYDAHARDSYKNRYSDVVPISEHRVKLKPLNGGSDYINASWIWKKKNAIACQAPVNYSIDDFWKMVWDEQVNVIVMLTKLRENGRTKANRYWPPGKTTRKYAGGISVTVSPESNNTKVKSSTKIKSQNFVLFKNGQRRDVFHIQYKAWPDMGVPEEFTTLKQIYCDVRKFMEYQMEDGESGKMVVHCSAGLGRTGVYLTIQLIMQIIYQNRNLKENERETEGINIYDTVKKLRRQRSPQFIQTIDQYFYVYKFLNSIMKEMKENKDAITKYISGPSVFWL